MRTRWPGRSSLSPLAAKTSGVEVEATSRVEHDRASVRLLVEGEDRSLHGAQPSESQLVERPLRGVDADAEAAGGPEVGRRVDVETQSLQSGDVDLSRRRRPSARPANAAPNAGAHATPPGAASIVVPTAVGIGHEPRAVGAAANAIDRSSARRLGRSDESAASDAAGCAARTCSPA